MCKLLPPRIYVVTPQIDVMLLFTETVNDIFGGVSDSQVMSTLATAIASSNQALNDSSIDAEFHLVYAGPVRIPARVFRSFQESVVLYTVCSINSAF